MTKLVVLEASEAEISFFHSSFNDGLSANIIKEQHWNYYVILEQNDDNDRNPDFGRGIGMEESRIFLYNEVLCRMKNFDQFFVYCYAIGLDKYDISFRFYDGMLLSILGGEFYFFEEAHNLTEEKFLQIYRKILVYPSTLIISKQRLGDISLSDETQYIKAIAVSSFDDETFIFAINGEC